MWVAATVPVVPRRIQHAARTAVAGRQGRRAVAIGSAIQVLGAGATKIAARLAHTGAVGIAASLAHPVAEEIAATRATRVLTVNVMHLLRVYMEAPAFLPRVDDQLGP